MPDPSGRRRVAGDRVTSHRRWVVLAYVAATLVAQLTHDHGGSFATEATRPADRSDGPAIAIATASTGHAPTTCAACQFRAEHQSMIAPETATQIVAVSSSPPLSPIEFAAEPIGPTSCRAPPRA